MRATLGTEAEQRPGVVRALELLLADEFVLYTKTRNYHWNVVGPGFSELHKFLDDQYNALNGTVDEVAERIRALGGWAIGTLGEFGEKTRLKESPGQFPGARTMLENLLKDHETVIRELRDLTEQCAQQYHDGATEGFLTELTVRHEKMAWMLRSLVAPTIP